PPPVRRALQGRSRRAARFCRGNRDEPVRGTRFFGVFPNSCNPADETRRLTSPYLDVLNIHALRRDTGSMRTLCAIVTVLLGVAVIPGRPARAQVSGQIAVPPIRFEVAPPLVVVSPGVQVVPEYEEEVFFVDGWYWHRSGPYWYRTRDYRGGWVVV